MITQNNTADRELTAQELEAVSGGAYVPYYAAINKFVHPMDIVTTKVPSIPSVEIVAIGR